MVDREVGAGASEQALLDYFDDLLGDAPAPQSAPPDRAPQPRPQAPARQAAETRPALPFAEPTRAFTLRMPLPALAPQAVETPFETTAPQTDNAPRLEPATPALGEAAQPSSIDEDRVRPEPEIDIARPVMSVEAPAESAPTPGENAAEPELEPAADEPEHEYQPKPWLANGRPEWAQEPFECLLFRVGGLALAVPLVELGTIYPLAEHTITPIFGQAQWFMGLLSVKHESVRVIDSAQVVMPERYDPAMREDYRYVITLNGSDWGLAVDTVINAVRLTPEQVRWRGSRGQRPWLAGTVVAQMCALIDGSQLIALFDRQDRKRRAAMRGRNT